MLASVDVHAPAKWRTNVIVTNFDEFHKEFDVKEGDGMWRPRRSCYYLVKVMKSVQNGRISLFFYTCKGLHNMYKHCNRFVS